MAGLVKSGNRRPSEHAQGIARAGRKHAPATIHAARGAVRLPNVRRDDGVLVMLLFRSGHMGPQS